MRCDLLINHFVVTALRAHELILYQPHALRAFVHVHDIARSFLFGIEHFRTLEGQVFNVGSEEMNYTKAQVCEMIQRQVAYCLRSADSGEDGDNATTLSHVRRLKRWATTPRSVSGKALRSWCARPWSSMNAGDGNQHNQPYGFTSGKATRGCGRPQGGAPVPALFPFS